PRLTATTASGWRSVVDAVHAEGSAIVAQLWHMGSEREPTDGVAAWTPSGVDEHGRPNSHAVTLDEVDLLVAAYADAASTASAAGCVPARVAGTPPGRRGIPGWRAAPGADPPHGSQRRFWSRAFPASSRSRAGWAKRLTGRRTIIVGWVWLTNSGERLAGLGG